MPELLIEFFSEEIPARMQKRAEEDLARLLGEKLSAAGLKPARIDTYSGPRRLAAVIADLPAATPDVSEERKGPRVGAPEKAIEGFLRGAGLKAISEAQVQKDPKGDFYVARIEKKGSATSALLAEIVPEIVRAFPWPKSMRSRGEDLQWVRPLQNVLVVFAGQHVPVALPGVKSEPITWGHRFHAPRAIEVSDFASYQAGLGGAHVRIDREERKKLILENARAVCASRGLELVEDVGLLEEVAGLAEWPVVLLGDMDPRFLDLPGEVIRLSMRTHQKYFAVRDPKAGKLAPHFVVVANIAAKDGGEAIAAGNARVLSARLNDARYFWDVDRFYDAIEKTKPKPLFTEERKAKLQQIVFHQKLGSVWDKVERVKALAVELCAVTGADPELVKEAAELCKMDLVTETVGEFPELQGQIGKALYLQSLSPLVGERLERGGVQDEAAGAPGADRPPPLTPPHKGEGNSVAQAIEDHYRPLGPNDRVPTDPVAVTLALADKLDTLVGFWAIDEKPTGSSDAYGLRRAALGIVRGTLNSALRIELRMILALAFKGVCWERFEARRLFVTSLPELDEPGRPLPSKGLRNNYLIKTAHGYSMSGVPGIKWPPSVVQSANESVAGYRRALFSDEMHRWLSVEELTENFADSARTGGAHRLSTTGEIVENLISFLADRLKVQLRDQGKRHDLVDAVFALGDDDLVRIVARVAALDAFLATEDGKNLLAGYKRAANILRAEEKKNADLSTVLQKHELDPAQLRDVEEKSLYDALNRAAPVAKKAVESEQFAEAMRALATLRGPVDSFFDAVLVNAPEEKLRLNRLKLLTRIRDALHEVADFSKVEG